jgi:hypothetical protein
MKGTHTGRVDVRRTGRWLIAALLVVAAFAAAPSFASADSGSGTPTVSTDQLSYSPGGVVGLSGTGFVAGDTVTVTLADSLAGTTYGSAAVTVASDGSFSGVSLGLPFSFMSSLAATATDSATGDTANTPIAETMGLPTFTPSITTDQQDYAPGSVVTITGSGWPAGDTVSVFTDDSDNNSWSQTDQVTADASGEFTDQVTLPLMYVANYSIRASDAHGLSAATAFTDGNLTIHLATTDQASPAPTSISFTWQSFNQSSTCSGSPQSTPTSGPSTPPFNVGIGGGNSSALAVSAAASGYTFAYFSNSATSTTPLAGAGLCFSNSGDVYVHFRAATRDTTASVTSNNNPSTFGQNVTFTATVSATAGNPGTNGTVTFKDGASAITGCSNVALNASSQATCVTSTLDVPGSPHGITGVYSGASSGGTTWNGSTSPSLAQTVNKASSVTTVTCGVGPFTYDGSAQTPCTASVTGAGSLSQSLTVLYSHNTNAGSASASATFAGDANHTGSSDSKNFNIDKANADCSSISGYSVTYDGTAHTADGHCLGVDGTTVLDGLDKSGTSNTNAGDYPHDPWTFTDTSGNYNNTSGTVHDHIDKANADCSSISGYDNVYNGHPYTATGACKGVDGNALSGLDKSGTSHTKAGTYNNDPWTFVDVTGNYNNASGTVNDKIEQSVLSVSFQVQDKVWDGTTAATIKTVPAPSLIGVVTGDVVSVNASAATANFADAGVGANKPVIGAGFTLGGADAGNYFIGVPQGTTTASILAWNASGKGFYAPVGIQNTIFTPAPGTPPVAGSSTIWNTVKGGQTVPLKFNVFAGTVEKTSLTDIASFKQSGVPCAGGDGIDPVDITTTGNTSLRYDTTAMQWIQNWKTPNYSASAACFRATVTFADGSMLSAFFKLTK